jgi:hypothetical protein
MDCIRAEEQDLRMVEAEMSATLASLYRLARARGLVQPRAEYGGGV